MTRRDPLEEILASLPESRLQEVLDFARFLSMQENHEDSQEFGRRQLARAYGDHEPEYGLADIKRKLDS